MYYIIGKNKFLARRRTQSIDYFVACLLLMMVVVKVIVRHEKNIYKTQLVAGKENIQNLLKRKP